MGQRFIANARVNRYGWLAKYVNSLIKTNLKTWHGNELKTSQTIIKFEN